MPIQDSLILAIAGRKGMVWFGMRGRGKLPFKRKQMLGINGGNFWASCVAKALNAARRAG